MKATALFVSLSLFAGAALAQATVDIPKQPEAPKQADIPLNPESPPAPEAPGAKLWPADTIPIFMLACTQYHKELIAPCKCTITKVIKTIPHDEFLKLSESGRIQSDQRYLNIRRSCIGTPASQNRK